MPGGADGRGWPVSSASTRGVHALFHDSVGNIVDQIKPADLLLFQKVNSKRLSLRIHGYKNRITGNTLLPADTTCWAAVWTTL